MKLKNFTIITFLSLFLLPYVSQTQEAILSSGGDGSGSGGYVSHSIGQISYEYIDNASHSVTGGVQQVFDMAFTTGVSLIAPTKLTLYPNPFAEMITVETEQSSGKQYELNIHDINGKLVYHQTLQGAVNKISLDELKSGSYLVKLFNDNNLYQINQIIKH